MDSTDTFKIILLGESGVGKTCILRRYVDNKFQPAHLSTFGIDFRIKKINVYDRSVKLKIWDTAGQERYHNITKTTFKNADGILLVFDVTDESSFERIQFWMKEIESNLSLDLISLILVGNKSDIKERTISKEKGIKLAESLKISYYETSALENIGIDNAFMDIAKLMLKKNKIVDEDISLVENIKIENDIPKKKSCC